MSAFREALLLAGVIWIAVGLFKLERIACLLKTDGWSRNQPLKAISGTKCRCGRWPIAKETYAA
jgi:hypothetical protein